MLVTHEDWKRRSREAEHNGTIKEESNDQPINYQQQRIDETLIYVVLPAPLLSRMLEISAVQLERSQFGDGISNSAIYTKALPAILLR